MYDQLIIGRNSLLHSYCQLKSQFELSQSQLEQLKKISNNPVETAIQFTLQQNDHQLAAKIKENEQDYTKSIKLFAQEIAQEIQKFGEY